MKKVAIMQPYLFPYIGYFCLIKSVDEFVIYDDVKWIKGGWINRNKILVNSKPKIITLAVNKRSSKDFINLFEIHEGRNNRDKFLNNIYISYKKAPYFSTVMPIIEDIIKKEERNILRLIKFSIESILDYLGIKISLILSSDIKSSYMLHGQDKLIHICKYLKSDTYINLPGGKSLYKKYNFTKNSINLKFIEPKILRYKQFGDSFCPYLSIIDILMFNSKCDVLYFLDSYKLSR